MVPIISTAFRRNFIDEVSMRGNAIAAQGIKTGKYILLRKSQSFVFCYMYSAFHPHMRVTRQSCSIALLLQH